MLVLPVLPTHLLVGSFEIQTKVLFYVFRGSCFSTFRIYNIKLRQFNVLLFYVLHPTLPFVTSLTGIGLFFILSRAS